MSEVRKDIVTRLRDTEEAAMFATPIQVEAANEIERLRRLLMECKTYIEDLHLGLPIKKIGLLRKLEKEVSDE